MRNFICFISLVIFLCSCQAASGFVSAGHQSLQNADQLDSSSNVSVAVGVLREPDTVTGLVGEAAVEYNRGSFTVNKVDGDTDLLSVRLGLRYPFFPKAFLRPYIGAGIMPQFMQVKDSIGEDETDFTVAGYGVVGVDAPLGRGWTLGLSYLHSVGSEFDLGSADDQDFDAGTFALVLGFSL